MCRITLALRMNRMRCGGSTEEAMNNKLAFKKDTKVDMGREA